MEIQAIKRGKKATWRRNGERIYGTYVQGDSVSSSLIASFALHLRLSGKSERTVESYCCNVELFARSIPISLSQASQSVLRNYIVRLMESAKYSTNTINLKIRSLRRFYGYLRTTGRIVDDPSCDIRESKAPGRLPRSILSASEMETIRGSITGTSVLDSRNRALVEVLYSTGMRLGELASLDIGDLDLSGGFVQIRHGKGGKERLSALSHDAVSALTVYLCWRRKASGDPAALWLNYPGNRLSSQMIRIIVKRAADRAGVVTPAHPHAWRHGVATERLRRGASVREVQVFLGHARLSTTQIYTHVTLLDLKCVHKRTHPRERDPEPVLYPYDFSLNCIPDKCRLLCYACSQLKRGGS